MKKILVLLVAVFAMGTFNVFATNNETTTSTQAEADNSFYTCQFSLNHYSGTVSNGSTNRRVVVYLNCPQKEDVTATVYVYVDGKRVASQLFTIKAGKKESTGAYIRVYGYSGKEYTLEV